MENIYQLLVVEKPKLANPISKLQQPPNSIHSDLLIQSGSPSEQSYPETQWSPHQLTHLYYMYTEYYCELKNNDLEIVAFDLYTPFASNRKQELLLQP
jgi:hypothetical protein